MTKPISPLHPRRSPRLMLAASPTSSSTGRKKTSKKPSMAIALHAEGDVEISPASRIRHPNPNRSTPIRGMQIVPISNSLISLPGSTGGKILRRSWRFLSTSTPAGNAGRKHKNLTWSLNPAVLEISDARRKSPRLVAVSLGLVSSGGALGSNVLCLTHTSDKKSCQMIKTRLGESNLEALSSERCLRSRKIKVSLDEASRCEKKKKRDCSGEILEFQRRNNPAENNKLQSSVEGTEEQRSSLKRCSISDSNSPSPSPSGEIEGSDVKATKSDHLVSSATEMEASHHSNKTDLGEVEKSQKIKNSKIKTPAKRKKDGYGDNHCSGGHEDTDEFSSCFFIGEPIPDYEARERWPYRYQKEGRRVKSRSLSVNDDDEDELVLNVKCHFAQAKINKCVFDLGDCAYMRGEEEKKHIGKIVEFFKTKDEENYCRVQWFYRSEDTVMKEGSPLHEKKRVFYSNIMNDNILDCVISKIKVVQLSPELNTKRNSTMHYDFFYDMEYCLDYSTFRVIPTETVPQGHDLSSHKSTKPIFSFSNTKSPQYSQKMSLLDLFSGCGGMSTGLCLGARMSGVHLITRWAVDYDSYACKSLKINHPETQVRNEAAEDFLELLKQWQNLCKRYEVDNWKRAELPTRKTLRINQDHNDPQSDGQSDGEELEVERLVDICYGDLNESNQKGLKFKVRWKGYGSGDDTWEPINGLRNCQELIHDFVKKGLKSKLLPLPGEVDVICGGPPCQGISGYNRFRSVGAPFEDERNCQLVVFMDIVNLLKPKYVLMENVVDILKFDKGSLGRYALSRLVNMNYQARVGIMAAGCYGLPQFRLRTFFWGALPSEDLPQFPLPTHDVILRYWPPPEFERNVVAYDEGQSHNMPDAVVLCDAISDLPAVKNEESADEIPYGKPPETVFQQYMRSGNGGKNAMLYDHRPLYLSEDDYIRVSHIPHRKGANFRDLPGIIVGPDNVVRRDPGSEPVLLPSGKPMVPDYALSFEQGKSKRPFARLWWDETVATVVTSASCHHQAILHPEQERVLTVRECARLQGFPDHYRFSGTVKHRYRQIGNAVAVPVAKALGFALGMASQKLIGKEALMELPPNFAYQEG